MRGAVRACVPHSGVARRGAQPRDGDPPGHRADRRDPRTLIAWGAAADRFGERRILTLGLAVAGAAGLGAASVHDPLQRWLLLFAVGASSSSIHAASGRLILGWFGARERGLAMGIRQMGQPLGVGLAAIVLPSLAIAGTGNALAALGVACLASAALIWLVVRDPVRAAPTDGAARLSPYREAFLWRVHGASGPPVIPQFAVTVFAFDYLVNALGWSITSAGGLLAATQLAGAGSRLLVGGGLTGRARAWVRCVSWRWSSASRWVPLQASPWMALRSRWQPWRWQRSSPSRQWTRIHRRRRTRRAALGRPCPRASRTRSRT